MSWLRTSKFGYKVNMFLVGWLVLGLILQVYMLLTFQPWGPILGVAASPLRVLYHTSWSLGTNVPGILLCFSYVTTKPHWLAPRGKYIEGQVYKVITPYRLVAIAMTAALFAACGVFRPEVFDLCALPAAVSTIYFDPIVGFFCLWNGGTLRSIFMGIGEPFAQFFGWGISDGFMWTMSGIYYRWMEDRKVSRVPRAIIWIIALEITRYALLSGPAQIWYTPLPAFWVSFFRFWVVFMPASVASALVGLVASEAAAARYEQ